MPKINWNEIQESDILVHRDNETLRIKFLNNGSYEMIEIKDNETNKPKKIAKYTWKVNNLDDRKEPEKERTYSCLSNRLTVKLKQYTPLKDKSFSIHRYRYSQDKFDIDFEVQEIKK